MVKSYFDVSSPVAEAVHARSRENAEGRLRLQQAVTPATVPSQRHFQADDEDFAAPAVADRSGSYVCSKCSPSVAFPNYLSFAAHVRSKHKIRRVETKFVDNSGICPACGTNFKSSWRVFEHLFTSVRSVKGRTYCIDVIASGLFPPVPAKLLAKYAAADCLLRHQCRHKGLNKPPCKRPATTPPIVIAPTKRLRTKTVPANISVKRFQIIPTCCKAAKVLKR